MELGTINEDPSRRSLASVLRAIGIYWGENNVPNQYAFVTDVDEEGLVESIANPYLASSVDGRFAHSSAANPTQHDLITVAWEHKTATTKDEVERCDRLAKKHCATLR